MTIAHAADPLPCPTILGLEHELGVCIEGVDAASLAPGESPAALLLRLGGVGVTCWDRNHFLENGGRLYVDCGDHPEYATPECSTIEELVAADSAGMAIVAAMAQRAEAALAAERNAPVRLRVLRNNLSPNGASWGAHENYLVGAELSWTRLASQSASHLASRVCCTGAGTVMAAGDHRRGEFRLSQRAPFVGTLVAASAVNTEYRKPFVLARDEPLSDPRRHRRVQVACGDSTMSQTSTALRVGATALALHLVGAGAAPAVELSDPVAALHTFAADPTLTATAATSRGRMRALDLQWQWFEAAMRRLHQEGLPRGLASVLPLWEEVLSALERDPELLADRLDWVAKRRLMRQLVERDQLAWSDVRVLGLDLAYHELHAERSLFSRLVRAGLMRTLTPAGAVERALHEPPPTTRAAARGRLIRLLRTRRIDYHAEWHYVVVRRRGGEDQVSLPDPSVPASEQVDALAAKTEEDAAALGGAGAVWWPWPSSEALLAEAEGRVRPCDRGRFGASPVDDVGRFDQLDSDFWPFVA
ncbi:MAG: proteasome accessory factor PafA2 family protein [Acidimicrobiales bacterium]